MCLNLGRKELIILCIISAETNSKRLWCLLAHTLSIPVVQHSKASQISAQGANRNWLLCGGSLSIGVKQAQGGALENTKRGV